MPRAKLPPTPATSTEPSAQDKTTSEMESALVLPPAAMNRSPSTPPVIQRKRTLSGSTKSKEDLPPPPSRARKIIQMKPKEDVAPSSTPTSPAKTASPKSRKQPSATSAAGRKIARKTAHSIIERRRRSKMNEEFGVLKDMIPACKGVEMHKLAILQAGIEYVNYLRECVDKLQDQRQSDRRRVAEEEKEDNDDEDMEETNATGGTPSASPRPGQTYLAYRRDSIATASTATASTHPSPALRPNVSSSSLASASANTGQRQLPQVPLPHFSKAYSISPPPLLAQTPTPTGVSPAFNAIHFSPDLGRTYSNQHNLGKQSPRILPLPQAAMSMDVVPYQQHGHEEATATAALMMLTNDRRANRRKSNGRGGGMSVRDLLSH